VSERAANPRARVVHEAVQQLLDLRGITRSAGDWGPIGPGDDPLHAASRALCRAGVPNRVVSVPPGQHEFLNLPTLVLGAQGDPVLLVSVGARHAEIKTISADGSHRVRRRDLDAWMTDQAIDFSGDIALSASLPATMKSVLLAELPTLAQIAGAATLAALLGLLMPIGTSLVIESALPNGALTLLGLLALGAVAVGAHVCWTGWLRERALAYAKARVRAHVLPGAFERAVRLPFPALQLMPLGEQYQVLKTAEAVCESAIADLLLPAVQVLVAMPYVAYLAASVPGSGSVLCASGMAGVALGGLAWLAGRRLDRLQRYELKASSIAQTALHELVVGATTIQTSGNIRFFVGRWLRPFVEERRIGLEREMVTAKYDSSLDLSQNLVLVALLTLAGHASLEVQSHGGAMIAGLQLLSSILGAMHCASGALLHLGALRGQFALAADWLGIQPEPSAADDAFAAFEDAVVADDVWFRHGQLSPWVLRGTRLRVAAGAMVSLESPSGSGKTTLLRILAGLYVPDRGSVSIFGRPPRDARNLVSYVPQTARLFDGTLLENLRMISGGAPIERLLEVARVTGLSSLLETWPMGLETRLSGGGRSLLSGGQRQLIILTGCVASTRPLILLDEAMSNIDPLLQRRLLDADLFRGRTVIMVMHRAVDALGATAEMRGFA
jgi:ABC-type bacteriocin/lantibiotic exporter with double-glycine peptidase domain